MAVKRATLKRESRDFPPPIPRQRGTKGEERGVSIDTVEAS
jgi:hypothetical protein